MLAEVSGSQEHLLSGECGKQGQEKGELHCNAVATEASANLIESSGAKLALQSCLRLDQGVWAFL